MPKIRTINIKKTTTEIEKIAPDITCIQGHQSAKVRLLANWLCLIIIGTKDVFSTHLRRNKMIVYELSLPFQFFIERDNKGTQCFPTYVLYYPTLTEAYSAAKGLAKSHGHDSKPDEDGFFTFVISKIVTKDISKTVLCALMTEAVSGFATSGFGVSQVFSKEIIDKVCVKSSDFTGNTKVFDFNEEQPQEEVSSSG